MLHENGDVKIDTFYKGMNTHIHLNYNRHHPNHIKRSIPFNLIKRIFVFMSKELEVALLLKEVQKWLLNCGYLKSVIDKLFFIAK